MKKKVIVAIPVHTPLYLPLYLAKVSRFFHCLDDYDVDLKESPDPDGDTWALKSLVDYTNADNKDVHFAVCDPLGSVLDGRAKVLATVVRKAAFWAVDRNRTVRQIRDFQNFKNLFTYPNGMTAYHIAMDVKRSLAKTLKGREDFVQPASKPADVFHLLSLNKDSAAMTADFLEYLRLGSEYSICYKWAEHAHFSNFMLTGLLVSENCRSTDPKLTEGMIRALQKSLLRISADPQIAQKSLIDQGNFKASEAEAQAVVTALTEDEIFPSHVTFLPDFAGWANAYKIFAKSHNVQEDPRAAYERCVLSTKDLALKIQRETIRRNYRFEQFFDVRHQLSSATKLGKRGVFAAYEKLKDAFWDRVVWYLLFLLLAGAGTYFGRRYHWVHRVVSFAESHFSEGAAKPGEQK